jgi:SAM-dependent methyltransferase
MNEQINREKGVHGVRWNKVHEGYFVDPAIAAPLVQKIQEIAGKSKPDTIVDLGGGTGALLSHLLAAGVEPGVSLIDLDDSSIQLDVARSAGFSCLLGSVDSFSRQDLGLEDSRALFMMRSVLHYFGKNGLRPVLRHLHAQVQPGEFFVHQTASFSRRDDANCLNNLYQMMRTQKWYPTVDFLCKCLREEGWNVLEVCPALPLRLKSDDLMQRYNLGETDIHRIRDRWSRNSSVQEDVFKLTDNGFWAFLHYWIYVCTPAIPEVGRDKTRKAEHPGETR